MHLGAVDTDSDETLELLTTHLTRLLERVLLALLLYNRSGLHSRALGDEEVREEKFNELLLLLLTLCDEVKLTSLMNHFHLSVASC